MPKISKSTVIFNDRRFDRDLSVNSDGVFTMKLPREIEAATGKDKVDGCSKVEVEGKWLELVNEWKKSKVEKRTVLVVEYEQQDKSSFKNHHRGDFFGGLRIQIKAYPYEETKTTSGDGKHRYDYKGLNPKDFKLPEYTCSKSDVIGYTRGEQPTEKLMLPLTPAVAQFFVELEIKVLKLQNALGSFLTDEKMLTQAITAGLGQALLAAPEKANKKKGKKASK